MKCVESIEEIYAERSMMGSGRSQRAQMEKLNSIDEAITEQKKGRERSNRKAKK